MKYLLPRTGFEQVPHASSMEAVKGHACIYLFFLLRSRVNDLVILISRKISGNDKHTAMWGGFESIESRP